MSMYKIAKDQLPSLFAAVSGKRIYFLPVKKCGQTNYGLWTEEAEAESGYAENGKICEGLFLSSERGSLPLQE